MDIASFSTTRTDFDKTPMVVELHEKSSAAPALILLLLLSPLPFLILACSFFSRFDCCYCEVAAVLLLMLLLLNICAAQVSSAILLNRLTRERSNLKI